MPNQNINILLVEDDEIDALAIRRAFQSKKLDNPITVVPDGVEALKALQGQDEYIRFPRPYVILLDIDLPRMNGFEFLDVLRTDADLKRSVVFVLTTSNRTEDIMAAYDRQIAGYLTKAQVNNNFEKLASLLESYRHIVELPVE